MRLLLAFIGLTTVLWAKPVVIPAFVDLKNKKDPVNGKRASMGQTALWRGLQIRFATAENARAFEKTPGKFLGKLGLAFLNPKKPDALKLGNALCPVTGKKPAKSVRWGGLVIGVHDAAAAAKFSKNPGAGFAKLGYAYHPALVDLKNTVCPVTEGECYVEAPIWADVKGVRVRVCCDRCVKEVTDDPTTWLKRMGVDPKKIRRELGLSVKD